MEVWQLSVNVWVVNKEPVEEFADERIRGILIGRDSHASYTVGIVPAGGSQRLHYQDRPDDGTEVIFVYQWSFRVRGVEESKTGPYDVNESGPVLVVCPSGDQCALDSVGETEVRFFSVFAPPFQIGEIHYTE